MNTSRLSIPTCCSILWLLPWSSATAQQTHPASPPGEATISPPPPAASAADTTGESSPTAEAAAEPVGEPEGAQTVSASVGESQAAQSVTPPRACIPECRAGFLCHEGTCLSKCNPPCASGELCSDSGSCVAPPSEQPPVASASAQPPPAPSAPESSAETSLLLKKWAVGGALGFSLPGTIYVGSSGEFDTETSYVLDLYADAIVAPVFSIGGFITHALLVPEDADSDASLWSLGFTMKARFALSNRVALRPGVVIGYNSITIDESDLDAFQGLNVGAHLDLAIALSRSGGLVPRLAFFSQPVGGNGDLGLDFAPIAYVAVGYEFGR